MPLAWRSLAAAACLLGGAGAEPWDKAMQGELHKAWSSGQPDFPCLAPECRKPTKRFERILDAQAGVQWMDHGGYCGSWSIQRAALVKGAWISQQQVRNHTVPGGGHDEEILETNIDQALKNLKLKAEGFDYKHLPTPQADAYRRWIKKKLVAGHAVVWMIMLTGGHYPVYPGIPYGFYSHVEPVVGILSDHNLTDEAWYDDDYIAHYTDANVHTYFRSMKSLPDDTSLRGNCASPHYPGYPCIYEKYGFGWSIEGFLDEKQGLPLGLKVEPSDREPDVRTGSSPEQLKGTVTVGGLTSGRRYTIFRWDSVESALNYDAPSSVHKFQAGGETLVYEDPKTILSSGSTYYRCIEDTVAELVV